MARPNNILISTTVRNQRFRGPTSSSQQNDLQAEVLRDLTEFQTQWNNYIVKLTATLPDGTVDTAVNAFLNGLDGRTVYINAAATSSTDVGQYYNTTKGRPNTLWEQFQNVYTTITNEINTVQEEIDADTPNLTEVAAIGGSAAASQINVTDGDSYFDSANVEAVLAEVGADLSTVLTGTAHRRHEASLSSISDDANLIVTHNAGMFPQVQVVTYGDIGTAWPANSVLPIYSDDPSDSPGVMITHSGNNQTIITNRMNATLASGVAIFTW